MAFKVLEIPILKDGESIKLGSGNKLTVKTKVVVRDGINGTGVTLPFTCGFCRDKGKPTAAFRSRRQRNAHTNRCTK